MKRAEHRVQERAVFEFSLEKEVNAARQADDGSLPGVMDKARRKRRADDAKQKLLRVKEDKMLFVAFHILINLAEDVNVEKKMVKKSLIDSLLKVWHVYLTLPIRSESLILTDVPTSASLPLSPRLARCVCVPRSHQMLEHSNADLLVLITTFLRKLSVFGENKNVMKELDVVGKVIRFVPCSSQALVVATLRLLFNLSFDDEIRQRMLNAGMCTKLVSLLKSPPLRARTLKLLYQLSVEDRCKAMFAFTDGIPLLVGMIINFPQNSLAAELAALAVNMTLTDRNCEAMVANRGLNHMIDRLATTRDPLLFKIIRNISLWTHNIQQEMDDQDMGYRYRGLWSPHIKVLLEIIYSTDDHETLIEVYCSPAILQHYIVLLATARPSPSSNPPHSRGHRHRPSARWPT